MNQILYLQIKKSRMLFDYKLNIRETEGRTHKCLIVMKRYNEMVNILQPNFRD